MAKEEIREHYTSSSVTPQEVCTAVRGSCISSFILIFLPALSCSTICGNARQRGPASAIATAPIGAVIIIDNTAMVRTCK